ncbi:MAG: hypothetical protein HYS98_08895, partial [Deltaproteobacteria bacterium]|nr:hypothetical protein [Deltaproteobacteria bacterium]
MSNNISARHDPFLHFVNRFAHRAYENRRILSFLFVALIVCGLSFLGWTYYGKGQEKKASDLYFLGQQVYEKVEAKKLEDLQSGRKKEEKKRVDSSVAPSGQPLNDGEKG